MKKTKEPTLFKVKLLQSTAYNDAGDKLEVKMVTKGDIYYYDSEKRWCYLDKCEEDIVWKRINRKTDAPKKDWENLNKNILEWE